MQPVLLRVVHGAAAAGLRSSRDVLRHVASLQPTRQTLLGTLPGDTVSHARVRRKRQQPVGLISLRMRDCHGSGPKRTEATLGPQPGMALS